MPLQRSRWFSSRTVSTVRTHSPQCPSSPHVMRPHITSLVHVSPGPRQISSRPGVHVFVVPPVGASSTLCTQLQSNAAYSGGVHVVGVGPPTVPGGNPGITLPAMLLMPTTTFVPRRYTGPPLSPTHATARVPFASSRSEERR